MRHSGHMSSGQVQAVIMALAVLLSLLVWIAVAMMMIATTKGLLDLLEMILKLAAS